MPRIILDTDPGIDDALALFLALASPEVQLEAVTTVSGNVNVDHTTRNALALLELAGRSDIPVARGSERPILRPPVYAEEVHNSQGLGYLELPEPSRPSISERAVDVIIEKVMSAPGEISLVAIGPLTRSRAGPAPGASDRPACARSGNHGWGAARPWQYYASS